MTIRYVKAVYEWRSIDDENQTTVIDLLLDGDEPIGDRPYLGHVGSPSGEFYPFLLKSDGTIDFGSDYEDERERYIETNFFQRPVRVGEIISSSEWNEDTNKYEEHVSTCVRIDTMLVGLNQ